MNEMPPMPPEPPPISEKKGIPALGWVGIGCGTLVVIAVLVISLLIGWCKRTVGDLREFQRNPEKAAAEMVVRMSPEVEKVSDNESIGEMTIRTKEGKEMTLSYKEIAEGRFMMVDDEGNSTSLGGADLTKVADWVPRLPGLKAVQVSIFNEKDGKIAGHYTATTAESVDALETFFKEEAGKLNFTLSSSRSSHVNGAESCSQSYSGGGKKLEIVITAKPGEDSLVNVGYEDKK